MNTNPLVAVVTLNWNGVHYLQECVDSILASNFTNFRVIVVDNGSKDRSLELLESLYESNPTVFILKNGANLGYSRGMNVGLEYGFNILQADFCLVMNNDTILDKYALTALVDLAQTDNSIAFVTGKVYYYDNPDTFQSVGKKPHPIFISGGHIGRGEKDTGQYDEDHELAFCDDVYCLVSKHVYKSTGGYDPEFFLQYEEFDWQLRVKKAGFRIWYAHKARIWHKESMSIGKVSPQKAYYDTRNSFIAIMKNCDPQVASKYTTQRASKVVLPAIIKHTLKGNFQHSFAIFRGFCSAQCWGMKRYFANAK